MISSKKGIGVLFWIIIVAVLILLGIGGYIFAHSQEPMQKDSDGKDFYTKGFVYDRTLFGWEVSSGDVCSGDSVQEKIVNKDPNVVGRYYTSFEEFKCPKGCQDGACIR